MYPLSSIVFPFLALGILGSCRDTGNPAASQDAAQRERMVRTQIEDRGIRSPSVLAALRKVPRHEFIPQHLRSEAYADYPLPIGEGQTISQPYIVALMTELAQLAPGSKVLEIGTGSGYQAAVLCEIVGAEAVFSIEIVPALAEAAKAAMPRLGYGAAHIKQGDGYLGWPEEAPFDAIIVTAAPASVPEPLFAQLKVGGRLVIPVGTFDQELMTYTRTETGFRKEHIIPVRFVPMTGKALDRP